MAHLTGFCSCFCNPSLQLNAEELSNKIETGLLTPHRSEAPGTNTAGLGSDLLPAQISCTSLLQDSLGHNSPPTPQQHGKTRAGMLTADWGVPVGLGQEQGGTLTRSEVTHRQLTHTSPTQLGKHGHSAHDVCAPTPQCRERAEDNVARISTAGLTKESRSS